MSAKVPGAKDETVAMRIGYLWLTSLLLVAAPAAANGDLRLVDALRNRDAAAVPELLNQQVDVNASQPDGATALHWAAHWDDVASAERLIRAGARVNAANDYGVTPLLLACEDASGPMIEMLLRAGADANAALPTGETALMAAARTGKLDAVKALVAHSADPNAKEQVKGQTALMWAAAEHHLDVARLLVEHGAETNTRSKNGFTPLLFAAREGDIELARFLLAHGAELNAVDAGGTSVLLTATVRGHAQLAHFLLDKGADPNVETAGYTVLHWVAGKWETGFTTDYSYAPGTTAEWAAVVGLREGKLDLLKELLARGADLNARLVKGPPRSGRTLFKNELLRGATPFYLAALAGDVEVMRLLLASGADPHAAASDGTTPLMVAAGLAHQDNESRIPERRYLEAVKLLVGLGADIQAVNNEGWSALHGAAYVGHQTVVAYLVEQGAGLNAKTKYGQTALGIAEGFCKLREAGGRIVPMAGCIINFRPDMAEFLRNMGAVSEGRVALDASGQLQVTTSQDVIGRRD